jgi:PmbA protein
MQNQKINRQEDITKKQNDLNKIALLVLEKAKKNGATSAEVGVSENTGFSTTVRLGSVETLENSRSRQIGITVYFGRHVGHSAISDFNTDAVDLAVAKACYIAKVTEEDPYCGLADPDLMAYGYEDLDLYHPWEISVDDAISFAKNCEKIGLSFDKRINNSEGASISSSDNLDVYGNSHGFLGATRSTSHNIFCSLIATQKSKMQRMYDYATSRTPISLESMEQVAKNAALETIKKLGAKHLTTCECPVIFRKELARGLFGSFVSAITGSNLYRKSSFLLDHLGKQVFSSHVSMKEDPHIMQGIGSTSFDSEGVRTVPRELVADGILNGYVLGSYSARKLSMKTTGNAGGIHNLLVHTEKELTFEELLKTMNTGLLVTELMGDGINIVTGNYSRGAFGYWVENGEIKYPVEGITIASNLKDMFLHIVAISNDVDKRGVIQTGSVLIDKMKVAGI